MVKSNRLSNNLYYVLANHTNINRLYLLSILLLLMRHYYVDSYSLFKMQLRTEKPRTYYPKTLSKNKEVTQWILYIYRSRAQLSLIFIISSKIKREYYGK